MKVVYSIGSKFGGHGIGNTALHAVRGIYRARALKKVLASYESRSAKCKVQSAKLQFKVQSSNGIPKRYVKTMGIVGKGLRRLAYYDPTGWGYVLHDNIFDRWAAGQLESCDIFHGWNHQCLHQLRGIKGVKGVKTDRAVTVVERASSHILQGQEILHTSFWPEPYVEKCLLEYEETDYIVVPSDYALQSFLKRGFDKSRLVKIPFGVDTQRFKILNPKSEAPNKSQILNSSASGDSSNLKHQKFVVLFVGEIRLGKGIQYLLEAWERLNLKDAELWLVGEVKRDFENQKSKIKNQKAVRFLGFRRDVAELMGQANVFAFPSLDEGSALVTYEAMAAGLPVVTTPNAGSLVRDSLDGYIIPIRDSDALAERLEFFYKYPEQGRGMGESGRERIKEFTWEKYGEELVKAYIKMLK